MNQGPVVDARTYGATVVEYDEAQAYTPYLQDTVMEWIARRFEGKLNRGMRYRPAPPGG